MKLFLYWSRFFILILAMIGLYYNNGIIYSIAVTLGLVSMIPDGTLDNIGKVLITKLYNDEN